MSTGTPSLAPPVRRRWRIPAAVIGAALLALGAAGWFWLRPRDAPPPLPAIDLAEADPQVARLIGRARDEVLAQPRSGASWGRLGQVLRAHGFGAEANECFREAERLDPSEPRWPYLRGLTLVLTDPAAGIACLERAVALFGDDPTAPRLRLVEVLLEQGQLDEAEAHLRQALRGEPGSPRAHLGLARLALGRSEWRLALEHLSHCARDSHSRKRASTLAAEAWFRLGDGERARQERKRAAESPEDEDWPDPLVAEVMRLRVGAQVDLAGALAEAETLYRAGRLEDVVRLLEGVIHEQPDAGAAWLLLGQTLLDLKDAEAAERALTQAVQRTPDAAEAWCQFGRAHMLRGRHREAADDFRRAIRLKPDHTPAHFHLGQCLKQLGDTDGAAAEFRQALRCQPDHAPSRAALQSLRLP